MSRLNSIDILCAGASALPGESGRTAVGTRVARQERICRDGPSSSHGCHARPFPSPHGLPQRVGRFHVFRASVQVPRKVLDSLDKQAEKSSLSSRTEWGSSHGAQSTRPTSHRDGLRLTAPRGHSTCGQACPRSTWKASPRCGHAALDGHESPQSQRRDRSFAQRRRASPRRRRRRGRCVQPTTRPSSARDATTRKARSMSMASSSARSDT